MVIIGHNKYTKYMEAVIMKNKKIAQMKNSEPQKPGRAKTKKHQFIYFISSFILTLAVAGTIVSFIIVDQNSRKIGWSDEKTALAFSANNKRMDFSIQGSSYNIDLTVFNKVQKVMTKLETSYDMIKPVPSKFSDELFLFLEPKISEIFERIYNAE
jgi:hypothetical protein